MLRATVLAASLFVVLAVPMRAAEHTKDSLATVKQRVGAKKAVLVDVRELSEWRAGHLERATLLPLSKLRTEQGLADAVKTLPKDTPIYVHCRSGGRCLVAGDLMKKHGLDVRPLKAGYADLLRAGFAKSKKSD